jgi:hypothetical protein
MDEKTMQEIFHEFISSLEALDTQNAAISQFLKDKGIAPQQELAPYLERAGNASSRQGGRRERREGCGEKILEIGRKDGRPRVRNSV